MKYELFKTKGGRYVNVVTREDVYKGLIEAYIFMKRNFKKGATVREIMVELITAERGKFREEDLEGYTPLIVDIYALIKNKILDKRIENLNMVLSVCECIHEFSFSRINDPAFEAYSNGKTMGDIFDIVITPGEFDYSMNSEFVSELATNIYNNYNSSSDIATKKEYLKIEKAYLEHKATKKNNKQIK